MKTDNIFECPNHRLLKESFIRGENYIPHIHLERTLSELNSDKHPQTSKYLGLRKKEGKQGSIFADVRIDGKHVIFQYIVQPTYEGDAEHPSPEEVSTNGQKWSGTNGYTVEIKFTDWWRYFLPKEINSGNPLLADVQDMIKTSDVKVHCSCPAFHWLGIKYELTKDDESALNPTNIANPVWKARNDKNYGVKSSPEVCKHLAEVIPTVGFNAPKILKDFKGRIDQWLKDGYTFDARQGFIKK